MPEPQKGTFSLQFIGMPGTAVWHIPQYAPSRHN